MKLVTDIIEYYELEFVAQTFRITDAIWRTKIREINRFGWNSEVFVVATAKTRNAKIP